MRASRVVCVDLGLYGGSGQLDIVPRAREQNKARRGLSKTYPQHDVTVVQGLVRGDDQHTQLGNTNLRVDGNAMVRASVVKKPDGSTVLQEWQVSRYSRSGLGGRLAVLGGSGLVVMVGGRCKAGRPPLLHAQFAAPETLTIGGQTLVVDGDWSQASVGFPNVEFLLGPNNNIKRAYLAITKDALTGQNLDSQRLRLGDRRNTAFPLVGEVFFDEKGRIIQGTTFVTKNIRKAWEIDPQNVVYQDWEYDSRTDRYYYTGRRRLLVSGAKKQPFQVQYLSRETRVTLGRWDNQAAPRQFIGNGTTINL